MISRLRPLAAVLVLLGLLLAPLASARQGSWLFVEPEAGVRPLLAFLARARSVDLNTYELTDRALMGTLAALAARGVPVRVLLARHPWRAGRILRHELAWCRRHPRVACRLAPHRFRFDHAKYAVFSGRLACLGTPNWTWSAFHRNREYIYCTTDAGVVDAVRRVFAADWNGERAGRGPRRRLVLSPGALRPLERLLRRPGPIEIESEEMGPLRSVDRLLETRGSLVRIVLPSRLSPADRRTALRLAARGVRIRLLRAPYMHAKMILTPGEAFVGSENISWTSLNRNREMGILLTASPILRALSAYFAHDWTRAAPLRPLEGGGRSRSVRRGWPWR